MNQEIPSDIEEEININVYNLRIPSLPCVHTPIIPSRPTVSEYKIRRKTKSLNANKEKYKRIIHYAADHAGCGWWRFNLIEQVANYSDKAHITNTDILIDPNCETYWTPAIKAVRLQRQVSPQTSYYFDELRRVIDSRNLGTRLIFEIDDIVISGKMPLYNVAKNAFDKEEVQKTLKKNISLCDEFTVVSPYMKQVYQEFLPDAKITVIPNFASRSWFNHVYDKDRIMTNYVVNKKRPRILISSGGTHYNMHELSPYTENDYTNVLDTIISTRYDFKYVWLGSCPPSIRPFINCGDMEIYPWVNPSDFPYMMKQTNCQLSIASLAYNEFNRSKSSIKFQEACYSGLPFVGQDIECYNMAFNKFKSGDEMVDLIKHIVSDEEIYHNEVIKHYEESNKWWLDDKIDDILNIYYTPFGDSSRYNSKWFIENNS